MPHKMDVGDKSSIDHRVNRMLSLFPYGLMKIWALFVGIIGEFHRVGEKHKTAKTIEALTLYIAYKCVYDFQNSSHSHSPLI